MRTIDTLLARYGESHRNHVNEWVHIVCVPLIVFSLLGLLWSAHPSVALLASILALYYYYKLSRPFAAGMLAILVIMLGLLLLMPALTILPVSLALPAGRFVGGRQCLTSPQSFRVARPWPSCWAGSRR